MRYLMFCCALLGCMASLAAQTITGPQANEKINGASLIRMSESTGLPEYVGLRPDKTIPLQKLAPWVKQHFGLPKETTFALRTTETDAQGHQHIRFNQLFNGVLVEGAMLIVHTDPTGNVYAINGEVFNNIPSQSPAVTEAGALNAALAKIGATQYKWQVPEAEQHLKATTGDATATWLPKGELVYAPVGNLHNPQYRLAWKLDVYAIAPLSRNYVFVDATTGEIIRTLSRIHHGNTTGTAQTKYSGTQTITTDSYSGGYRLRETGRGDGISTFNLENGYDSWNASDFTDADNLWNNVNADQDEVATDAHFATEKTYDYYFNRFNRNSIDGQGFELISYVHYDYNFANAFWDGTGMYYGDGDGFDYSPLTTLDICGHEVTHGLTEFTAGLYYEAESGALNESFSDIFGTAIEFYARGGQGNWLVGEDCDFSGYGLRNMQNPKSYGYPDTYDGDYWTYTGPGCDYSDDYCGVHNNSSVQNYWFYLLAIGGSGTNDINQVYSVNGIGLAAAEAIAYRTLTVYLTPTSDFDDARFYSLQSALDLYGGCSNQYVQTANAWHAVGVGQRQTLTANADFSASTFSCGLTAPVPFQNLSTGASSYTWYFGDGTSSTATNPTHTYANYGTYTITLVVVGCNGDRDTLVRPNYVEVLQTSSPLCNITTMPSSSAQTTACAGRLLDSGGANGEYDDFESSTFTIKPTGATSVTLNFTSFNTEDGYDYLYIYDGLNTSAAPIGYYTGSVNIPPITSSGGAITLYFSSDASVTAPGFDLVWSCTTPSVPPVANISFAAQTACSNTINFTDGSSNNPSSWMWQFGDGSFSTSPNPTYTYTAPGVYEVILSVTNSFGTSTDTIIIDLLGLQPSFTGPDTVNLGQSVSFANNTPGNPSSYLWILGNGTTSNNINPTTTYNQEGLVTVQLKAFDSRGCEYTITKQIWVRRPVGIFEAAMHQLNVYPNPASNQVFVSFDAAMKEAGNITLYNMLGEAIQTQPYAAGSYSTTLDITSLAGGVYLLRIDGEEDFAAARVVKY